MLAGQAAMPLHLPPSALIGAEADAPASFATASSLETCVDSQQCGLTLIDRVTSVEPSAPPRDEPRYRWSGNIAAVSDYRVAGVTSTGHAAALQGELDVDGPNGWSAGVWASTIERTLRSNFEVDLYGAREFHFDDTAVSLGALGIILPGGDNAAVGFVTANVSRPIGPFDVTLDVRYAWPQGNIEDEDDLYASLSANSPIGRLAGVPLTLGLSVGYEHGAFAIDPVKYDWSLSVTANFRGVDIGVSYVDTNLDDKLGSPGCILSVTRSF